MDNAGSRAEPRNNGSSARAHLFDRQALVLVSVILLTEAAISVIFFALVQQYPAHLLRLQGGPDRPGQHLLRAGAVYAGYALSAYGVAKLPAQPLSGLLADRFGARRLLLTGLAVCVAVIVIMTRASDVTAFVAACAVYGLAAAVIWPAVYALVGDFYRASSRGRITAAISGAQMAGSAGGFAGGALLIDHAGFGPTFAVALGLDAAAFGLGLWRACAGTTADRPSPRQPDGRRRFGVRGSLIAWRSAFSADLLMLSAILVLVSLAVSLLAPNLKPYSASVLHVSFSTLALLLAVPASAAVLTLIPSGIIADRMGRSVPMIVAAAGWAMAMLALTFTRSLPFAVLFATLAASAYALGLPAWSASLIDLSIAGRRGFQVGLASAVQGVGLAAGPAIGGEIVLRLGSLAPFRFSAALMAAVLLLSLAYRSRLGRLYTRAQPHSTVAP